MITKLTIEQEQQVKEYYDFYLKRGLSTQPANKQVAEKAIKEMYKLINEKEPKCIWVNSPTELVNLLKGNSLRNSLRNSLYNSLYNSLWNSLYNSLRNSLYNSLYNSLRNSLRNSLYNSLWNSLYNSLTEGQFYSPWIGFYEYGRKVLFLEYSKEDNHKLDLWIDMLECSYFFVLKGLVVLMEHPLEFHVNNKGITHSVVDFAIKFRDNTGIYVLHGKEVTQEEFKNKEKLMKENKISKLEYLERCYNEKISV